MSLYTSSTAAAFIPSILKTKARRVLSYFNKYGFSEVQLTIHVLDNSKYNVAHVVGLEQYFMDQLRPRLNVDPIAAGSGTRGETSQEAILRLHMQRGLPTCTRDASGSSLLHVFLSKTYLYALISIHHSTLKNLIENGGLYHDSLYFSLDPLIQADNDHLMELDEFLAYVEKVRSHHKDLNSKHPKARIIIAENILNPEPPRRFRSLSHAAEVLKGDRGTMRKRLNSGELFRKEWVLSEKII